MRTAMKYRTNVFTSIRYATFTIAAIALCTALWTGCSQVENSRCNPALSHNECDNDPTVTCIQNNSPGCAGEAYCCRATDPTNSATITSSDPTSYCAYIQQNCPGSPTFVAPEAGGAGDDGGGAEATAPDAPAEATAPDAPAEATAPDAPAEATAPEATAPDAPAEATAPDASGDAKGDAPADATSGG
jgi:hypothetical protein